MIQTISMLWRYAADPPEVTMTTCADVHHQRKHPVANVSESELGAMAGDQRTRFACNRSTLYSYAPEAEGGHFEA